MRWSGRRGSLARCHPARSISMTPWAPGATACAISAKCRLIACVSHRGRTRAWPTLLWADPPEDGDRARPLIMRRRAGPRRAQRRAILFFWPTGPRPATTALTGVPLEGLSHRFNVAGRNGPRLVAERRGTPAPTKAGVMSGFVLGSRLRVHQHDRPRRWTALPSYVLPQRLARDVFSGLARFCLQPLTGLIPTRVKADSFQGFQNGASSEPCPIGLRDSLVP